MPFDPTTPRSRDEVLLRAIVTGDSASMGEPRDREEEFVKAIADIAAVPDFSEASEGDVLQIGTDGPEWAAIAQTTHIYQHHVVITASGVYILFTILSNNDVRVTTKDKFLQIFDVSSGSSSMTGNECCSGKHNNNIVVGVDANGSSSVMLKLHTVSITYNEGAISLSGITDIFLNMNNCSFSDTVKTLI